MTTITGDLRLAFRGLRRNPLFASVAILSLALGIGANTTIFTLLDQLVLRRAASAARRAARGEPFEKSRNRERPFGTSLRENSPVVSSVAAPEAA